MATTDTSESRLREPGTNTGCTLIGLLCLMATTALAADFESQVIVGIAHTDNVTLVLDDPESEKIYFVEPSFRVAHESDRISADADYLLQAYRYHDFGETEIFQQYDASIRAALIPENFFLEIGGSRVQVVEDPELSIPQSNLPISGNRLDLDEYYAGPSFQYALDSAVTARGEYRHRWLEYGESDIQGNEQSDADFSIDNYRQARGLTWALRYDWHRTEYELDIPWEYQRAMAEMGFWVGTNTRLFAATGKESAWDMPLDPKLEDSLWEVGFSQQLGDRLSAEFAGGERSFGNSWRGNLEFEFRRGSMSFSYTETPTTVGRVRYRRGAFDEPEIPEDVLTHPGDTERFIAKRLQWVLNMEFRRSDVSIGLYDIERTERTEADGTLLDDESQRGGWVSASFRVGPRTDLRMGSSWTERELQQGDTSEWIRATVASDYRLGNRTTLSLEYEYTEEDEEGLFALGEYVANTVSLFITYTL